MFFIILPIGNIMPEDVRHGHADSAPEKHYFGYKVLISLALSIILALCCMQLASRFPQIYTLFKY